MYELIKVTPTVYYIQSPAKIGIIKTGENCVILIDSGNDKDAGKKVFRVLEEKGWQLKAIFNTHSHADHIGGNKFLQDKTGCKIYSPGLDKAFTTHPILEPALLYGGNPPKELKTKFLYAKPSNVEPLSEEVMPDGVEIVPLPGHSFDMVGFKADNVIFLADSLSGAETLEKYQIGFLWDVQLYLETLEKIKSLKADVFIPSHAEVTKDITDLANLNINKVNEVLKKTLYLCQTPKTFEELLQNLFQVYGLNMTFEQYALVGSTVKSYLTYLKSKDKIKAEICDNKLLWKGL